MAARRLTHTLVVRHPETHEATALVAGSELPEWAADLVDEGNLESDKAPAKKAASSKPKK